MHCSCCNPGSYHEKATLVAFLYPCARGGDHKAPSRQPSATSMSGFKIQPADQTTRSRERTIVVGYLVSTALVCLVFIVVALELERRFASNLLTLLLVTVFIFTAWATTLLPFVMVRCFVGARSFSSPLRAAIAGCLIGILAVPCGVTIFGVFDPELSARSFVSDLAAGVATHGSLFAGAGATGGLIYWLIEFSRVPSAINMLLHNRQPVRWTRSLLSTRLIVVAAAIPVFVAAVQITQWWWRPHVFRSATADVPSIVLSSEWQTRGNPSRIEWSGDGLRLISFSGYLWMRVQDLTGRLELNHVLPNTAAFYDILDQHRVIMPGDTRAGIAFSVNDVVTNEVSFSEKDPAPDAPGTANNAVHFALSGDKSLLAVGYGFPRSDQPISLYRTHDWRKLATIDVPADAPTGVGKLKLSPDGKTLAFAGSHGLVVVDVHSGSVIRILPIQSADFAFSPSGGLLAVATLGAITVKEHLASSGMHIFRLVDGVEVASSPPADGPYLSYIRWDPLGRFLVFADDVNVVHVWNPFSKTPAEASIQLTKFSGGIALSPDGRKLAVGNGDLIDIFQIGN